MKAGTTTLFRDLVGHPQIFLPQEKEPETLIKYHSDIEAVCRDYASLFAGARHDQLLGEASTAYTKRPDYCCPADLALRLCGPALKLIYLKRNPMKRIVSQYKHEFGLGLVTEPLNEAIMRHPRYIDYSRYDWQLQPWLSVFERSSLLVLSFEEYIADRAGTVDRVCRFLGVDPTLAPPLMSGRAFNASENKPTAARGIWKILVASRLYQRTVKPHIPWAVRDRIASMLLPKMDVQPEEMTDEVRRFLEAALSNLN